MSQGTAEETEILVERALSFLRCQLAVFPELQREVWSGLLWF